MPRRLSALPLTIVAVMLLTASEIGARETKAEWQARVDALKQEYEAKMQAVATADDKWKLAQAKGNSIRFARNPYTDPNYQRDLDAADRDEEQAWDARKRAVDERDEAQRRWSSAVRSPPRQPEGGGHYPSPGGNAALSANTNSTPGAQSVQITERRVSETPGKKQEEDSSGYWFGAVLVALIILATVLGSWSKSA